MGRILTLSCLSLVGCVTSPPEVEARLDDELEARLGFSRQVDAAEFAAAREEALSDGHLEADEALRLAIGGNLALRARLRDLGIAAAAIWQASLPPNPTVGAEVQFLEGGAGELLEVSVTESIIDLLLIPIRRQVEQARYEATRAEVTGAVLDLAAEVRSAYRRMQAQAELVELFNAASQATHLSREAAQRLRDAGNIIELEVVEESALHEEMKVRLALAQAAVREHRENLNLLLGIWGPEGESWSITPRLPLPGALEWSAEDLEREVVEASLDLAAARNRLVAIGRAMDVERLEVMFPSASAGIIGEREADGTWAVGPVVSTSVPIFDFGQAVGEEAEARILQAYERFTDMAVRVRRAARSTYVRASTTGESSRYYREKVLPLRASATEQTLLQFNAMQLGVFELLMAKRREIDAGRRYVELLREHWLARIELETLALGRLPQGGFGLHKGAMKQEQMTGMDPGATQP